MVRPKMKMKSESLLMLTTDNNKHKKLDKTKLIAYNMLVAAKNKYFNKRKD